MQDESQKRVNLNKLLSTLTMKIQFASDLHLEFRKNREFIKMNPLQIIGDVLVLAGDVIPFAQLNEHDGFLDFLAENFQYTYWIPGNHEYYHNDFSKRSGTFEEHIRENVILLNNQTIIRNGFRLIFSTLWSHISPQNEFVVLQSLNNFNQIKVDDRPLRVADFNAQHRQALSFLKNKLRKNTPEKNHCSHTPRPHPAQLSRTL